MLLRTRSILAQASILVLITLARSQHYDSEYNAEDDDDHSGYTSEGETHKHPDYSKYFNAGSSGDLQSPAAQLQGAADNGFVAPLEFSSFFGSPQLAFGGSSNQDILKPLATEQKQEAATGFVNEADFRSGFTGFDSNGFGGAQDYFEQAQKQKQKTDEREEEEEGANSKPGPSYISHRIPAKKSKYDSEVETLKQKPSQLKYSSSPSKNSEADESDGPINDKLEDNLNLNDFKPSPPLNIAQFQPNNPSKILEDAVGTLNNLPVNPEYFKKLANPPAHVTPYQKYSFQPAASTYGITDPSVLNILQNTAPVPFNPSYAKIAAPTNVNYDYQPTEAASENLKGKDCVRINKEVSNRDGKFNKQPMSCYVCKDQKSGAKSEHCSYSNEPNPKSYYKSTSYKSPDASYRNKRDESESYSDPYEEIKAKSHEYYSRPDDFSKSYYKAPDLTKINEPYSYPGNFNDKEAEEKSYSEIQSEELLKKGENCKKNTKNGVTCTVCTDAKTGANFEQCSYESAPNEKKYAYVKESKYDGEGNPIEEKQTGSTVPQPVIKEALRRSDSAEDTEDKAEETRVDEHRDDKESSEDGPSYDIPSHFSDTAYKLKNTPPRGLDPALYGGPDSESEKSEEEKEDEPQRFANFDDYHLKLFPQFANQESKREETKAKPDGEYFAELSGKKDVEKVLEEFTKKDRSNCKQVQKKGMTCYLCIDQKGIQQEECMYVSESRPQSSHIAYHEVQHMKSPKKTAPIVEESRIIPETEAITSESQKKSKVVKEATSAVEDNEANASTTYETRIKYTPEVAASDQVLIKNKRNAEKRKTKEKVDDSQDPQPEFDVEDEGGLYTAETEPVYRMHPLRRLVFTDEDLAQCYGMLKGKTDEMPKDHDLIAEIPNKLELETQEAGSHTDTPKEEIETLKNMKQSRLKEELINS
ncbi:hypothetical protein ILUMI_07518 [Ignelater luminosus]|uniref:Uncharacterized protein n=1 Tax=Ignelater luminosus TaxID=2038154 RepID=A0A8K0GEB2_IGNLU|nr:hypothetical protein ILUMI_07518 [Ignelater luminosus]